MPSWNDAALASLSTTEAEVNDALAAAYEARAKELREGGDQEMPVPSVRIQRADSAASLLHEARRELEGNR